MYLFRYIWNINLLVSMTKHPSRRNINRLVTFLPPRDYQLFRELAYQRNQRTAELIREILHSYLTTGKVE
jgi:hypothetical protein